MNISLFWDKTFVVRPTSDLKKLKFLKICQKLAENRQNTPLGPFLGVRPKKIFFKKFQLININLFWDKSFALKSRITNFCMKSDILQQIASCKWHGFENPRGNRRGFLKRPNNLVFYHQEGFRQLKNLVLGWFMHLHFFTMAHRHPYLWIGGTALKLRHTTHGQPGKSLLRVATQQVETSW